MDFDRIALFLDVVARGSFAGAAELRGVAPSSVSRAIGSLEEQLGVRLFHRTTRSLQLTDEGALFRSRVQPLSGAMDDVLAELRESGRPASGTLRISASVSFGQAVLAGLLPAFHAAHPGVRIEMTLSDRQVDLVAERIDLAIRHGKLDDSSLSTRKLLDVRYRLCASPDYLGRRSRPQSPDDLRPHDVLTYPYARFRTLWTLQAGDEQARIPIDPVATISSATALRDCARGGMGIAVLPDWLGLDGLDAVLPDWSVLGAAQSSALWMLTPSRRYRPKRVAAFMEYLETAIRPVR